MTEQTLSRLVDIFRLHELPNHRFEPVLYTNRKGQPEGGFKIYRDGELLEIPVASEPSGLYYYLKTFSGRVRHRLAPQEAKDGEVAGTETGGDVIKMNEPYCTECDTLGHTAESNTCVTRPSPPADKCPCSVECGHPVDRHQLIIEGGNGRTVCHDCPPTTPPAESVEDRATALWMSCYPMDQQKMIDFVQAELERQTPAIIEAFIEEVEDDLLKEDWRASSRSLIDHVRDVMQTVKARRSGGEGK